ncbi:MAG TPA: hypothetical protein VNT52_12185 [Acidimicrobiales bacterium]|nr:hypothetical protein [Acidimicrobiales bacterium]
MRTTASVPTTRAGEVTLRGRITAAYGDHVFAVGSEVERVIVVTGARVGAAIGREVDVTGQVRTCRRQDLEGELGVDLAPAHQELENRSCLVASVARLH